MENAVSGYSLRMDWLKTELYKDIDICISEVELRESIAWYLIYGLSMGIEKNDLINNIISDERVFQIAKSFDEVEILNGKKPPTLRKGDEVEVIVNVKNRVYHRGIVVDRAWHYKEKKWFYYICENGKKINKRYCDKEFKLLNKADGAEKDIE